MKTQNKLPGFNANCSTNNSAEHYGINTEILDFQDSVNLIIPQISRSTRYGRMGSYLSASNGGSRSSNLGFNCSSLACSCQGDADCNDMFSSNVCGDIASCNSNTGICGCLRL